jgi:hypothetical protein
VLGKTSLLYTSCSEGIRANALVRKESPMRETIESRVVNGTHTWNSLDKIFSNDMVLKVVNVADFRMVPPNDFGNSLFCTLKLVICRRLCVHPVFEARASIFGPDPSGLLIRMVVVNYDIGVPVLFEKIEGIKQKLFRSTKGTVPITYMKNGSQMETLAFGFFS